MSRLTHCCPAPLGPPISPDHRGPRRILSMKNLVAFAAGLTICALLAATEPAAPAAPRWFKGNLHTHSLWSDGDDYPEMIADRYKQAGYHFLAISDHNVLAEGTRWLELKPPAVVAGIVVQPGGGAVLDRYVGRFGAAWVEQRETTGKKEVRLKPLAEYRTLLEEPGRFLLIPGAEITAKWHRPATATAPERGGPVHLNHTNPVALVAPVTADNALEIMQRAVDAVLAQRAQTGQPMLVHLSHPNYIWGTPWHWFLGHRPRFLSAAVASSVASSWGTVCEPVHLRCGPRSVADGRRQSGSIEPPHRRVCGT